MQIDEKAVLITGANRGIGRALLEEALARGAARVYAGTRTPFRHADPRVVPLDLDVTDEQGVRRAVDIIERLDVLINNVLLGPVDTDINRGLEIPKAAPLFAAKGILDGLAAREEDIFPDPMSQQLADGWRSGLVKSFERQSAAAMPTAAEAA